MQDYFDITIDNYPTWYELSWNPKLPDSNHLSLPNPALPGLELQTPTIILRIHRQFIEKTEYFPFPEDIPFIDDIKKQFNFKIFSGNLYENFGFDNSIVNNGFDGDFSQFLIHLPTKAQKKCSDCQNTGWDDLRDGECIICNGTGKMNVYDWHKAFAISASLGIFFRYAEEHRLKTTSLSQLMTVNTLINKEWSSTRDILRVMIGGKFSPALCDWFRKIGIGSIDEIVKAMKTAYDWMQGFRNESAIFSFYASIDYPNGWLNIHCPGNACGLNPCHNAVHNTGGYEFADHNVDTPFQQLTLLAGLATLHDKARTDGI